MQIRVPIKLNSLNSAIAVFSLSYRTRGSHPPLFFPRGGVKDYIRCNFLCVSVCSVELTLLQITHQ